MEQTSDSSSGLQTEEVKRRHILPKALVVGLVAGLLASGFRIALQSCDLGRIGFIQRLSGPESLVASIAIGAFGGALGLWLVRRFAPEAAGSGIPHLKSVVMGEAQLRWRRILPVKFLAGVFGIGGGLTLGREGPTIQMGGATGLMVSTWFKVRQGEGERKALISAGSAAGLAAAFNAPLAGLIFVLEELNGRFTPVVFVASFLAAVTADVVCRVATGETPVFALHGMPGPSLHALPIAAIVGVAAGFGGVLFNRGLLRSLDLFERLEDWPPAALGAAVGTVIGFAAWVYPEVSGSGALLAAHALSGSIAIRWMAVLLLSRFLLTLLSYGCGAAGGIFAPLLVLGCLGGLVIGSGFQRFFPDWAAHPETLAIIGMGALFTASVRAPLTGIVLMIELTGTYDYMLPLLVACFAAYGIAEGLRDRPIYESLRERGVRKRGPLIS